MEEKNLLFYDIYFKNYAKKNNLRYFSLLLTLSYPFTFHNIMYDQCVIDNSFVFTALLAHCFMCICFGRPPYFDSVHSKRNTLFNLLMPDLWTVPDCEESGRIQLQRQPEGRLSPMIDDPWDTQTAWSELCYLSSFWRISDDWVIWLKILFCRIIFPCLFTKQKTLRAGPIREYSLFLPWRHMD